MMLAADMDTWVKLRKSTARGARPSSRHLLCGDRRYGHEDDSGDLAKTRLLAGTPDSRPNWGDEARLCPRRSLLGVPYAPRGTRDPVLACFAVRSMPRGGGRADAGENNR